jgi:hypothetical protein
MNLTINQVALIPLITALIELSKQAGLSTKYCPILSIVLGLLAGAFYINPINLKEGIVSGLMVGLSASGLYSSTKNVNQVIKN